MTDDIAAIRAAAAAHPACGSSVYLDRDQCDHFEADYFGDGATAAIAASTLLQSKDYDSEHRDLLAPLGGSSLALERQSDQGPGWFTITAVFAPSR